MQSISRLTDTALASAVYASREALPLPCKTCFRLAGCAFSGRVSNPLDHDRRFLVTFPSSFSGLCLTLAQFDCKNTAYGIIMGSSGWQVVHCPGFHQYLLCTGGDLTPWVGSSFPPTTPCIGSGKRRLCTAHARSGRCHVGPSICREHNRPTLRRKVQRLAAHRKASRTSSMASIGFCRWGKCPMPGRRVSFARTRSANSTPISLLM